MSAAGSPNSEINCRCEKRLHPLRIAGRPEAFALFVLFVQEGPDHRSSAAPEDQKDLDFSILSLYYDLLRLLPLYGWTE